MKKRFLALAFMCLLTWNCIDVAEAAHRTVINISDMMCIELETIEGKCIEESMARATEKINANISAGKTIKNTTAYSLENDDIVRFNLTYSPTAADMDFGLIAPDGKFYYLSGSNGTFSQNIQVNKTGKYYMAVRNNSKNEVAILGFVYY